MSKDLAASFLTCSCILILYAWELLYGSGHRLPEYPFYNLHYLVGVFIAFYLLDFFSLQETMEAIGTKVPGRKFKINRFDMDWLKLKVSRCH
jgi:hypothetical protein